MPPQQRCFSAADASGDAVYIIKWGQYLFSYVPVEYVDILYDMLAVCRPRGAHGPPEYFVLARSHRPHQFCLDMDTKAPKGEISTDDYLARVEGVIALYERFIQEYHQHTCRVRAYVTCGTRGVSETHEKHSYHVLLRCDKRCAFSGFAQWREFAQQFLAYLRHPDVKTANPWLYHDGGLIVDDGIYTEHRAMRMPGSCKTDGVPMTFAPLPATSRFAVPECEHNTLSMHLHPYIEPGPFVEFAMVAHEQVAERLPRLNARPRHRPIPPPQNDERDEHILNIIEVLIPGRATYTPATMTISAGAAWAYTVDALLHLHFSDATRALLYDYMNWWRVCCIIARYVGINDRGRELWYWYARQKMPHVARRNHRGDISSYESGERQWQYVSMQLNVQPPSIHGFHKDMQWLGEAINVEWQLYTQPDTEDYPCPATGASHNTIRAHIDQDMLQHDGSLLVRCDICKKHVFCGYVIEKGAHLSTDQYISNNERLVRLLRATARTRQRCKRTIVVASNMGTGKSWVLRHLEELEPHSSVLVLSVRQLLSVDLHNRLVEYIRDMKHYIKDRTDVSSEKRLVIQLDSIHKLQVNGVVNRYDVVILEEIRSLLAHLSSSTLEKRRRVICQILMYIVTNAGVVIALDADVDPCSYQFLRSLRQHTTFDIFRNLSTPCARKHVVIKNRTTWYTHLRNQLAEGKNIFLVSNCKRRIDGIMREYQEQYRCLTYTSKTPQRQKLAVSECNTTWLDYQLVAVSPVVSAGLNFDRRDHFHSIFSYLKGGSACARESCQQEGRVRTMVSAQVVYAFIDNRLERENLDCVATVEGCLDFVNRGLAQNFEFAAPLISGVQELDFSNGRLGLTPECPIDMVFLENMAERMRSLQDYFKEYKRWCLKHGDTVVYSADRLGDEVSTLHIDEQAGLADLEDSQSLSQSLRPGDAGQAMQDMQTGNYDIDPNCMQQEQWSAFFGIRGRIDSPLIWDVIKRSGFLGRYTVCLLVLHPAPHAAISYISANMFQQHMRDPPNSLARFLRDKLAPYERKLGGYDRMFQRAELVKSLIAAVFGDVDQTARHVEEPLRTWLDICDHRLLAKVECPRSKWDNITRANAKSAVREVLALAELEVVVTRDAISIDPRSLDIMYTLSHLACPDAYAPRGGVLSGELSV